MPHSYGTPYGTPYGTLTAPDTVTIERLLPGPIEHVWAFLTDSGKRGRWLASGPMELRIGGRVENLFHNNQLSDSDDAPPPRYAGSGGEHRQGGLVTACEPPVLLSYIWNQGSAGESEVRFELSPRGEQVLLKVIHRRLPSREEILSVAAGWHTHLDILQSLLTGQTPPSFWRHHTQLEADYTRRFETPA